MLFITAAYGIFIGCCFHLGWLLMGMTVNNRFATAFESFLKDRGAFEKFTSNLGRQSFHSYVCDPVSRPSFYILEAFQFCMTPEGYTYWRDMDCEWQEVLRRMRRES